MTIFASMPVASWKVRGFDIAFPVSGLRESGANRLIERERPYRRGAKLDDTGSKARRWSISVLFENTIEESGLERNGVPLYPDVLRLLTQSFDVHEVGDLVLPTQGAVRARAETYDREETPDSQDSASVTFTFIEDNEDDVDSASFKQPSANANARRLAEQTTFDMESVDNGHFSISDLTEAVSNLEGLVNAPFDLAQDVENAAKTIQRLAARVVNLFSQTGRRGRDTLTSPKAARANRRLVQVQDLAARAAAESRRGRPVVVRYVVQVDTSMFQIAGFLRQSLADLLVINPQIEQPFYIARGTEVRVFAATGQVR